MPYETLKNKREFDFVYKHSNRFRGAICDICVLDSKFSEAFYKKFDKKDASLAGFSVSKKIGNAVQRNKIKRRFRAILRGLNLSKIAFIIIAKNGAKDAKYAQVEASIKKILGEKSDKVNI